MVGSGQYYIQSHVYRLQKYSHFESFALALLFVLHRHKVQLLHLLHKTIRVHKMPFHCLNSIHSQEFMRGRFACCVTGRDLITVPCQLE